MFMVCVLKEAHILDRKLFSLPKMSKWCGCSAGVESSGVNCPCEHSVADRMHRRVSKWISHVVPWLCCPLDWQNNHSNRFSSNKDNSMYCQSGSLKPHLPSPHVTKFEVMEKVLLNMTITSTWLWWMHLRIITMLGLYTAQRKLSHNCGIESARPNVFFHHVLWGVEFKGKISTKKKNNFQNTYRVINLKVWAAHECKNIVISLRQ